MREFGWIGEGISGLLKGKGAREFWGLERGFERIWEDWRGDLRITKGQGSPGIGGIGEGISGNLGGSERGVRYY